MTSQAAPGDWPSVSVVIPTRNRPQLLALAIESVLGQRYDGEIECLAVHDRTQPQVSGRDVPGRRLRIMKNTRSPGVAGTRNTGVLAASGELVAFCDDDDTWEPDKLRAQALALASRPDAIGAACGCLIAQDGRVTTRHPPTAELTHRQLLRSRVSAVHPSAMIFRRAALLDQVGLVDESLPGGYAEDYDWLLRATAAGPLLTIRDPLVRVLWHTGSFFNHDWETMIQAIIHLSNKHPDFATEPRGLARLYGRVAFAHAALGSRRDAREWALRALRLSPLERRAYVALAAGSGLMHAKVATRLANAFGRGI